MVQAAIASDIPQKEGYTDTAPVWDKDGKNITGDTVINAVYTKNVIIEKPVQTGDNGILLWLVLAIISGGTLVYNVIKKRKQSANN